MARHTRTWVAVAALSAAAFTLVVTILPFLSFAYRSVEAHMAIETTAAITSALAAVLLYGRILEYGRHSDLALFAALLLFAGTNLCFSVVPPILGFERGGGFSTWAPVAGRLASAAVFAWAAFAPDTPLQDARAAAARVLLLVVGALALVIAVVAPLASVLPHAIDPELSPEAGNRPRIVGEPGVLAVQAVAMLLYAAAAYGFLRRSERTHEELSGWLAIAATLGSFARLNYLLFPSLYSEWVYTGDFLRLGFFAVLLVGAAREIMRSQRLQAEALMVEERRRMARDIHDGLAQELAFIATHAQRLGPRTVGRRDDQAVLIRQLRDAAQRALDESRSAIEMLTLSRDERLSDAICRAAENVGVRYGARVEVDLDDGFQGSRALREAMVRVVREAVMNAVRHGGAQTVHVKLRGPDPIVLLVRDDGKGFDPDAVNGGGFGLTSMRERARALGGELRITSALGEGATVELRVP